jgi:hypothetical protein
MVLSMLVLALGVLALTGLTRSCSFSPGGPSANSGAAPSVDAPAQLQQAARSTGFPIRLPALPAGWRANSAATVAVGSGASASVAVETGWLTPGGHYLKMAQSGGMVPDLVRTETGQDAGTPSDTIEIDQTRWSVFPGVRTESAWVADFGGVRVLLTGNGDDAEFRTLAVALRSAAALPAH